MEFGRHWMAHWSINIRIAQLNIFISKEYSQNIDYELLFFSAKFTASPFHWIPSQIPHKNISKQNYHKTCYFKLWMGEKHHKWRNLFQNSVTCTLTKNFQIIEYSFKWKCWSLWWDFVCTRRGKIGKATTTTDTDPEEKNLHANLGYFRIFYWNFCNLR